MLTVWASCSILLLRAVCADFAYGKQLIRMLCEEKGTKFDLFQLWRSFLDFPVDVLEFVFDSSQSEVAGALYQRE